MAAKKRSTSKKTSGKSGSVTLQLDEETILTLNAAVHALSEFAAAIMTASDDLAKRAKAGKGTAKKTAKKRARKTT